jgi:AcrR family transcriptional regulator
MATPRKPSENKRRIPRQTRATETLTAILEAAAQILEADGLAAFTTNAVAERAGVSIGTLYQYFADKNAILLALARQQVEATLLEVDRALQDGTDHSVEGRVRAVVHAMVHAFRGRQRARRAALQAILAQDRGTEMMAPIAAFIARTSKQIGNRPKPILAGLTPEQIFVLSRSVMGTVRAAVLEEQPFLRSRAFEDEVVRLVASYVAAINLAADRDPGRTRP